MTPLVKQFGEKKLWTNWRYENVGGKKTKVPYFSKSKKAKSDSPLTWKIYEEAETALNNGLNNFDGVGIFFKDDKLMLGIDIDHCLKGKEIIHEKKSVIEKLLREAKTYVEISPSKTGLHLFFILTEPYELLANKKAPFEIYNHGRYLTVTNEPYIDFPIRVISPIEMESVLSVIGYPWKKKIETEFLTDEDIVKKMFSSKNGKKIQSLYEGDLSGYKNDKSSADMALCGHLAFWTGKNSTQMERIWTQSPLGQREKTKERKDYRDRTIAKSIELCTTIYENPSLKVKRENPDIDFLSVYTRNGKEIVQNTENLCRVLRTHSDFKNRFRHDSFKNIYEIDDKGWRQVEDNDAINVQTAISIIFPCFIKVGKEIVYDALLKVCKENTFDSAIQYIQSLKWDGTSRLSSWLSVVYGAPNDIYHQAVGSNWLKGMVKRLVEPGCKFDFVLVLEGEQGVKKSTSLAVLGGEWHTETTMSTDTKDFFMQFQGKSIIEFSEGETLNRTEVKRMKAIITMQSDRFRVPYERSTRDFRRRCVFAMTTNQTEYLKDETGNRRWLPVVVSLPKANLEWLKENREQLFAEAYNRVTVLKETIYEFPEEETVAAQNARRIHDPNADLIANWYFNVLDVNKRNEGITIYQVYRDALYGYQPSKIMDKWNEMSIADVLKNHLKLEKRDTIRDKVRATRWFNPNVEMSMEDSVLESAFKALES